MGTTLLTTNNIPPRNAFSYWQDVICGTFIHLECSAPEKGHFKGSIVNQPYAELQISTMISDEIDVRRTRKTIAAAREEYCIVVYQGCGQTLAEQDGRQVVLEEGDIAMFDSVRPYFARLKTGFQHYVFKIPRDLLRRRLGPLETYAAIRIPGGRGVGRLASEYMRRLPSELQTMDPTMLDRVAEISIELTAAALASARNGVPPADSSTRAARLARAKNVIDGDLHKPGVSVATIAAEMGISGRYLNMLFAREKTSVGRYLWDRRFEKCRAALADRLQAHRTVSEIAFGWGFNDMSHFSRAFKERFGVSPKEYRSSGARL